LVDQNKGWRVEDLRELTPQIYSLEDAQVIFTEIRGSIEHL